MSVPVRKMLAARLNGDAELRSLLAPHPVVPGAPAIIEARRSEYPDVYDCITLRFGDSRPDARFRPTAAEGGGRSPIDDDTVDMEVWSNKKSSAPILRVGERLAELLDGRSVPLPDGAGRAFRVEMTVRTGPFPDNRGNSWGMLLRFRVRAHHAGR